jgi:hypothetical protein
MRVFSRSHYQLPTTNYQLPTTNYMGNYFSLEQRITRRGYLDKYKDDVFEFPKREEYGQSFKLNRYCLFCGIKRFTNEEEADFIRPDLTLNEFHKKYVHTHRYEIQGCCHGDSCQSEFYRLTGGFNCYDLYQSWGFNCIPELG